MKGMNIYLRLVMCLVIILGRSSFAFGQNKVDWSGEISSDQTISANTEVTLKGDVTLKGTVTINSGVTLTINGNDKKITTYTTSTDGATDLLSFVIKARGKLVMDNVTLDGGNPSTSKVGNTYEGGSEGAVGAGADFTKFGTAIVVYDDAILELTKVNACNLSNRNYAAFIYAVNGDEVLSSAATITMTNVNVDNCLSKNDNGIIYTGGALMASNISLNNCQITNCMVKANDTGTGYGGVIKGAGSTNCQLTMTDCTMSYCWGSGWGGAILWAASGTGAIAKFKNCTFNNNYARYLGGAISTEATIELTGCNIYDNVAGFGGGGIAAFPFTLSTTTNIIPNIGLNLKEGNQIYQNKTLFVHNNDGSNVTKVCNKESETQTITQENSKGFNPRYTLLDATDVWYPSGGGGIYILMNKDGWNANMDFSASGNRIYANESASEGGGVYVYKQIPYRSAVSGDSEFVSGQEKVKFLKDYTSPTGQTSMELAADISNNKAASSGGGVSVGADDNTSATWTYPTVTVSGGKIEGNTASKGNGGGVYMPGGAFILNGGEITGNTAQNGGGISISNGSFELGENAEFTISGNTATRYGGGLYVSDATREVIFDGGTIENNKASAGGGVALEKNSTLKLNANVENNNATNGGGVYLNNNVSMTYTGGLLRNNTATSETTTLPNNTASKGTASTVTGVGGGVFMDNNTTLSFNISEGTPLGLYGNTATNAADDIFANGIETTVTLPSVAKMSLADFSVPASTLFWAEDYHTNDNSYPKLIKSDFSQLVPAYNLRYQYALKNLKRNHIVDVKDEHFETFKNAYVCLALGYQIYYVTIKKHGLQKNESALFNIYSQKEGVKIPSPYLTMLLTGDGNTQVEQRVALPEGSWKVDELTNWTWSYEPKDGETEKPTSLVEQNINDNTVFEFYNKKATTVLHGEDIEVNTMGTSSSSSSTGGSSTPAQ